MMFNKLYGTIYTFAKRNSDGGKYIILKRYYDHYALFIKISSINHHGFFSVYLIQSTPILALLLMSIPALIDNDEMVTKLLNYKHHY
ncbi:hypothetical protein BpHYR1_031326 [Brachionus plicatilis]|uniref:Uncharacterized protein n=1 Tax=Brachionus plicatilis TaxID=10195 RepID=A0A3M7QRL5_BRAPC|nr:hypothetical protein BpHYR1_031326 [Brachionus plicatilis]